MAETHYVRWEKDAETGGWIGYASTGKRILAIEPPARRGRRPILRRPNGSPELMSSIAAAKAYGDTLAKLWRYPPLS